MPDHELMKRSRAAYRSLLKESVRRVIEVLSSLDEVERVSLFGSYARGRADLFTDLDILVIMRTDQPLIDRLRALYGVLALPVDLDLLCYTPEEFRAMKDGPFLKRILEGEVVLHEKKPD